MARFGTPEALVQLSTHTAPADSVELKTSLRSSPDAAAEALTGRPAPTWSTRQTYLVDTAGLDLLRAGVEVRLRRRARGRYDLAVSARRTGSSACCRTPRGGRVELDVVPGGLWLDVEVRCEVDPAAATEAIESTAAGGRLLSSAQRAWACRGGQGAVDEACLRDLRVHGPLVVSRVKVASARWGLSRADLEHFRFPSGRELVELSTHCGPRDVARTVPAFERMLDEQHVEVDPQYRPRTAAWRAELGCAG
ncbi:hypothetical protein [Actinomycetospora termitidis]|uniref:CYTH domain-containing protein n=1 Tax=Actinomycetospora termitidis TaxID=3053470 RepID=A0ABT7M8W3_9PSEU|nr:hypothetical protein [Actinomycetospora sp. Odt1-22]MDL5156629.1 hypothetical protein [Actinomycetospora sp. Odt1-22]